MNVVDSSGWLEYCANGPAARCVASAIEKTDEIIVFWTNTEGRLDRAAVCIRAPVRFGGSATRIIESMRRPIYLPIRRSEHS